MRVVIAFFCILLTFCAHAQNTNCYGKDADTCKSTAGCYYESSVCNVCDADSYCPANSDPKVCNDETHELYPNSDEGAEDINECYNTLTCQNADGNNFNQPCKFYYDGRQENCPSGSLHIEDDNTEQLKCYANIRRCTLFGCTGYNCRLVEDPEGSTTLYASWDTAGKKWNVSNCRAAGDDFGYPEKHCLANATSIKPTGNNTYVPFATSLITFDTILEYSCSECDSGYYATNGTTTPSAPCHKPSGSSAVVCSCQIAPKGFYMQRSCGWEYPLSTGGIPGCQPTPCPAGKTTEGAGSASASACKYTSQTKFCDSKGCFTLGDDIWNEI